MSRTNAIDTHAVNTAVTAERLALVDVLEQLEPAEWQTRSWCAEWTVHHVVAHLSLATLETFRSLAAGAIKARGNFDRMTADMAIERAEQFSPAELIAQIRETAASTRRAPLSSPLDPLVDILVHGQDIVRPLERPHPVDAERAAMTLTYAVESRWYGGTKRFTDLKLVATDTPWTWGSGDGLVTGTAGDLLLLATGRNQVMANLEGAGVAVLADRQASTD